MLRTTSAAAVRVFKPVQVAAVARRGYSEGTFSEKERAEEARFARQRDAEKIKKLQEELAKREKEIADLKNGKK
ncbi:hypothetical protein BGX31_003586 [Mortierella sp. GBA43]|nr:hypothetical protein BGX31_003586 [Mortierella sp. GBA43]